MTMVEDIRPAVEEIRKAVKEQAVHQARQTASMESLTKQVNVVNREVFGNGKDGLLTKVTKIEARATLVAYLLGVCVVAMLSFLVNAVMESVFK